MKRILLGLIVVGLLMTPVAAPAAPPDHPPIAGTWTTVDCASWWVGGNPIDCSLWGDGSTIYLTIKPGNKPTLWLTDDYSAQCVAAGEPEEFTARGKGWYEVDQPTVRTLNAEFTKSKCGKSGPPQPWFDLPLYWDPGSDTMWSDVPWDDTDEWGYTWHRVP